MSPIDPTASPHPRVRDTAPADGTQDATRFGDSLRAAARRSSVAVDSSQHEAASTHSAATDAGAADERSSDARPQSAPTSRRHGEAQARAGAHATPTARADTAQSRTDAVDPRDARPRAHAHGPQRDSRGSVRRHGDKAQPPEGVALQTLLAAAHPLLPGSGDAASAAALTPHDVAASVTQTWLREPSQQDVAGADRGAQWTFTLGDPLTPLAALRISGDAAAGWGLQLTAGNGLPARDLAAYTERLRRRLRARGQAVDRLEVDDDPQR